MPIPVGPAVNSVDELASVAHLAEPVRLELHRHVFAHHEPVGQEEAARELDVSLKLAASHLDRLVQAEMLDFGYRRPSGRTGADRAARNRSD